MEVDVNPCSIAALFSNLVSQEYPSYTRSDPTIVEQQIANELLFKFLELLTDRVVQEEDICEISDGK